MDTGFEVSESFYELSFGEPRWRPSPLSARMVAAGPTRPQERPRLVQLRRPAPPSASPSRRRPGGGDGGMVVIAGDLQVADELRGLAREAGWDVPDAGDADGEVPWLIVDCGGARATTRCRAARGAAVRGGLAGGARPGRRRGRVPRAAAAGAGALVELTRTRDDLAPPPSAPSASSARLGQHTAWVGDAPGLVLGRIVCQLVNEAAFAVGEGVGTPRTSTPAWCSGSTIRAARSPGPTRSASTTCSPSWTRCTTETRRSAIAPPRCCASSCGRPARGQTGHGFHEHADASAARSHVRGPSRVQQP